MNYYKFITSRQKQLISITTARAREKGCNFFSEINK